MGTLAETEIVDYHLSFANPGKSQSNGSLPFPFSVNKYGILKFHYIYIYINIYVYVYICIYIYAAISNEKLKPRRFSLIRLPFAHSANESLSVC
jgi:hypothetical protein